MTSSVSVAGTEKKPTAHQRYRLPGIEREGIAQLSILETALWPLHGGKLSSSQFETSYDFNAANQRRSAHVTVYSPDGLQPNDEYILWGLLGLSLSRPQPESTLLATPYWMMQQLGMACGGSQYHQFRAALERLALVAYQNTGFFNPVTRQHERVTFHFFSSFIPTHGRGGDIATDRAWRIEWDQHFFQLSQTTGGTLLFDLDLYRELSPAARRLFLKLKDRFWRTKRVFLNVDDLTINGLGFSPDRPLKKRKYDLITCIRELLAQRVIEFGRGQTDPRQLFFKRSKGCYVVVFYEGEYFRQVGTEGGQGHKNVLTADPLFEPLRKIGVDQAAIRRIFARHSRALVQRWIKITDAAMHEKPQGFAGFKVSPAAFFIDAIENERLPPDWMYAHEKLQQQTQWNAERRRTSADEQPLRDRYQQERTAALDTYLRSATGRQHFAGAYQPFLEFYRHVEPHRPEQAAAEAARGKVEREHFQFPEFGVWLLNRQVARD